MVCGWQKFHLLIQDGLNTNGQNGDHESTKKMLIMIKSQIFILNNETVWIGSNLPLLEQIHLGNIESVVCCICFLVLINFEVYKKNGIFGTSVSHNPTSFKC